MFCVPFFVASFPISPPGGVNAIGGPKEESYCETVEEASSPVLQVSTETSLSDCQKELLVR